MVMFSKSRSRIAESSMPVMRMATGAPVPVTLRTVMFRKTGGLRVIVALRSAV